MTSMTEGGHTGIDPRLSFDDPLLDGLLILCKLHGATVSRTSLSAGLPLNKQRLSLDLLPRAAARAGLQARLLRRELKDIFGPCNERLMLKAMRLYGAFATLNVRFSNDKLLSMGMPKPPRFTDYIARCVQTTQGLTIPEQMAVDFK